MRASARRWLWPLLAAGVAIALGRLLDSDAPGPPPPPPTVRPARVPLHDVPMTMSAPEKPAHASAPTPAPPAPDEPR